jgi:Asp-tRNA(Asn)/Glu-tRNA(Gln) amidotransferase A subunit family amidase
MTDTSPGAVPPPPIALTGPYAAEVSPTLVQQAESIRRGELSSRELTRMYLERIEALDGRDTLNAYILSRGDEVLAQASTLDELQACGKVLGPLHGIPLAIKDNLFTAGTATSNGTSVLRDFVPKHDATVVRHLRTAGALVLGKASMHECAFGITNDNPHFGAVRNPYDPSRIPGGSSGGSGAAVAARLCSAAVGTDTGGSVRIPAALCGVAGIKPTLGRVGRGRTFGLAWSCDVPGPIARTVEDAAVLLRVMSAGPDKHDPAAVSGPDIGSDPLQLRGLHIGVPDGYFAEDNAPDVDGVLAQTHKVLEQAGAILVPVTVHDVEKAIPAGFLTVLPEFVVELGEALRTAGIEGGIAGHLDEFGPDVRAALSSQVGPEPQIVPGFAYAEAVGRTIPAVRRGFADALADVDVLLTPTTPATAAPIAEAVTMQHNGRSLDTFATFIRYTFAVSVSGLPAISVPAGVDAAGLPVGVQFIGPAWSEGRLIGIARAYEQVR